MRCTSQNESLPVGYTEREDDTRTSKFTETQILVILKRVEAGEKVGEACRAHGISEQTYYRWKAKYGGMEANQLQRLRQLEDENHRLKRIVADLTLDNTALKEVLTRN